MTRKPTYKELERRIKELEKEAVQRKEAEESLYHGKKKYRNILSSIEEGYYEVDLTGNLTFFNDSLCKIYGYARDELMGMNNREYMTTETAKKAYEIFNRVYKTGEPTKIFDWEFIKKDGAKVDVEISVSLIRNSKGKEIGFRGIVRDIRERKRIEAALQKAHNELLEANMELKIKTKSLEEVNTAMKVLLKKREEDKEELENNVLKNVKELIAPYFKKIKKTKLEDQQKTILSIIESNLNEIISPFNRKMSLKYLNLTPTEIQIANLIRHGSSTKRIAELMNVSPRTIDTHRKNIRRKIGLQGQKKNLRSHLLSLQ